MSTNSQSRQPIRQAILSTAEFSYLLNLVSARNIVGVDNDQLFPVDEIDQKMMCTAGFQQLVEHGWLIKEGNKGSKHNISNQLVLMVATVANPELTMMITRYTSQGEQVITYYYANDRVVEQIRTADDQYRLVPFSQFSAVTERLRITLGSGSNSETVDLHSVTLSSELFGDKLKIAQSGNLYPLQEELSKQQLSAEQSRRWTQLLANAKPSILVEWGLFVQNAMLGKRESFIIKDSDPRLLVINDSMESEITITPCSDAQFIHHIQTVWQEATTYRRDILSKMRSTG